MSKFKFCIDCKHHELWDDARIIKEHRCNKLLGEQAAASPPQTEDEYVLAGGDVVTGSAPMPASCFEARYDRTMCGVEGKWWEKRDF